MRRSRALPRDGPCHGLAMAAAASADGTVAGCKTLQARCAGAHLQQWPCLADDAGSEGPWLARPLLRLALARFPRAAVVGRCPPQACRADAQVQQCPRLAGAMSEGPRAVPSWRYLALAPRSAGLPPSAACPARSRPPHESVSAPDVRSLRNLSWRRADRAAAFEYSDCVRLIAGGLDLCRGGQVLRWVRLASVCSAGRRQRQRWLQRRRLQRQRRLCQRRRQRWPLILPCREKGAEMRAESREEFREEFLTAFLQRFILRIILHNISRGISRCSCVGAEWPCWSWRPVRRLPPEAGA